MYATEDAHTSTCAYVPTYTTYVRVLSRLLWLWQALWQCLRACGMVCWRASRRDAVIKNERYNKNKSGTNNVTFDSRSNL
jgi:hypothetical protein